ncbi:MAG: hypothetical protein C5B50_05310 [Verrucomicrobia bacterium]|nr:MAG: hypothetical protein C5B50_05310 [Verrucomicrobiota bacterium]
MATLCYIIHGIGAQTPDYSAPLQQGIHRKLTKLLRKLQKDPNAAKWKGLNAADLVRYEPIFYANIGAAEQNNLYLRIFPELFGTRGPKKLLQHALKFAFIRDLSINLIGDVFTYIGRFQEPIKRRVFKDFLEPLEAQVKAGQPFSIVIVAHSLGSIILHDLLSNLMRYHVQGFQSLVSRISVITMGSPISLFSLVNDDLAPKDFLSWVNFIHYRDPIAFPIGRLFKEVKDVPVRRLSWFPVSLHTCYWKSGKVHKAIANTIIEHHAQNVVQLPPPGLLSQEAPVEVFQSFRAVAGFSTYISDFSQLPFKDLFANATQIDIVLVYGRTWIGDNALHIAKALSNPQTVMRVCTLSPDSPAVPGLAYHFDGITPEEVKKRVEEITISWIKLGDDSGRKGHLKLFRFSNNINHSIYRFDDLLYFVPRSLWSNKIHSSPPALVYRRTSDSDDYFAWIMRNFERAIDTPHDATLFREWPAVT